MVDSSGRVRRTRLARTGALLIAVALAGTVACDPGPRTGAIGAIRIGGPLRLTILFRPCPGDTIADVQLVIARGHVLGDDDPVLWEVARTNGALRTAFVPGTTPPGYRQVVALHGRIGADESLGAIVESPPATGVVHAFKLADLSPTQVYLADSRTVPLHTFLSEPPPRCP